MTVDLIAFLTSWSWEPLIVFGLLVGATLYAVGWRQLAASRRGQAAVPVWRAVAFYGGLVLVGLALLSPIETFSSVLFIMHMLQHMLLFAAAPLTLLGSPLLPILWSLPRRVRREIALLMVPRGPLHRLSHLITHPIFAASFLVFTLALWHAPSFYDAAQGRTLVHDLEHVMFLGSSALYWWPVVHPAGGKRRLGYGVAVLYLAPNVLVQNAIGMVLTFADRPLYQAYLNVPRVWGISVVLDQQLAGAVMGIVGTAVNFAAMTALVALYLRGEDDKANAKRKAHTSPHR